jgi:hypothetical protein
MLVPSEDSNMERERVMRAGWNMFPFYAHG